MQELAPKQDGNQPGSLKDSQPVLSWASCWSQSFLSPPLWESREQHANWEASSLGGGLWGAMRPGSFCTCHLLDKWSVCAMTQSITDWPKLVPGPTLSSSESTQPLERPLRAERPEEESGWTKILQKQDKRMAKGQVTECQRHSRLLHSLGLCWLIQEPLGLCGYFHGNLKELELNETEDSIPWSHQPHLKCSIATCGRLGRHRQNMSLITESCFGQHCSTSWSPPSTPNGRARVST